jgi:hypothetical protein
MLEERPLDKDEGPLDRLEKNWARDVRLRAQAENQAICRSLCERLRSGTLPPDEAYWWTRIAVSDMRMRLADSCAADPQEHEAVRYLDGVTSLRPA